MRPRAINCLQLFIYRFDTSHFGVVLKKQGIDGKVCLTLQSKQRCNFEEGSSMKHIVLLLTLFWVVGCSTPPAAGVPTALADVCTEENRDKRVAVTGYLRLSDMMTLVTTLFCWTSMNPLMAKGKKFQRVFPSAVGRTR
jgi:hypothetical protein